jgi:hypothetical protein
VGHEGLLGVKWFLDSSTPHREAFASPAITLVSRNNVPGHHN